MTVEEAIEQLKFDRDMIQFDPMTGETYSEEQLKRRNKDAYKTWLADGMAIEALQKQEPKKPIDLEESIDKICVKYICPGCRKKKYKVRGEERYCQKCGQRIDWVEQEESE